VPADFASEFDLEHRGARPDQVDLIERSRDVSGNLGMVVTQNDRAECRLLIDVFFAIFIHQDGA
jgi:hypothetical protein